MITKETLDVQSNKMNPTVVSECDVEMGDDEGDSTIDYQEENGPEVNSGVKDLPLIDEKETQHEKTSQRSRHNEPGDFNF